MHPASRNAASAASEPRTIPLPCPAASAPPALAQFYRYVDANGHVRFTDNINQVPEKQRVAARSYVESPGAPTEVRGADESAERKTPAPAAPVAEVATAAPAAAATVAG